MRGSIRISLALAALACVQAAAEPVPRAQPAAGSVIARKSGEEVRFIDVSSWQVVDLRQDVVAGDYLRTNAYGTLAVLFADRTQMRLGRNTTLLVKEIGGGSDTRFSLEQGSIWARAERGGVGLTVDTPAAAAAIRGTDWTMTVDGNGRTSLTVLEGTVELANEFGSVSVAEGEAAAASIGSAPTKLVIVAPKDREQMLFFLSARSSFNLLPASSLSSADMRKARSRITAIAPTNRSAEDWLTLAEVSLSYEGRDAALEAATRARGFSLSRAQKARLDLVDALIAGADQRYVEAAQLFAAAAPHLDRPRRAMAEFGGYYARSLADPTRAETPPAPAGGGPNAAIAEAFTAGFLVDIKAAIAVLEKAERRYPGDPTLPAIRAQFAMLLDDREQMEEGVNKALALDPDDPTALEARSFYRAGYKGDIEGAYADIARAAEIAPGSTTIWNQLGLVQSARGADREAEAALKRAIELDPKDPVSHANLAIHYLDQDRVAEAKAEIDKALEVDPAFDVGLIARGRYHLQTGELDKARDDLLAGTTANPGYSQGLLLLAAGYYESGDLDAAAQALKNADRLDPNDPVISSFRTAIAIDDYDAEAAIDSAQEALRRSRARGGDYASLSANRDAGSLLNNAFRLQGLNAWGRFYGDAVFDPFSGSAFVDQAVSGSPDPFVNDLDYGTDALEPEINNAGFSSFFQGLLLDPQMISGRSRSANLFRRPFLEGSIGGGFVANEGDDAGWTTSAEVQGFAAAPFPISIYGSFSGLKAEDSREQSYFDDGIATDTTFTLEDEDFSGTGYIAAKPTPYDRVVAYVDVRSDVDDIDDFLSSLEPGVFAGAIPFLDDEDVGVALTLYDTAYARQVQDRSMTSGLAWSHAFGYRNMVTAGVFSSGFDQSSEERGTLTFDGIPFYIDTLDPVIDPDTGLPYLFGVLGDATINAEFKQASTTAALSHSLGLEDVTLRYGIEGGRLSQDKSESTVVDYLLGGILSTDLTTETSEYDVSLRAARAYFDVLYEISPTLTVEAGLFGNYLAGETEVFTEVTEDDETESIFQRGEIEEFRAEPRFGVAWEPVAGQWLRGGYIRESGAFASGSLAPAGIVGLQSNQLPLGVTGYSDTFAARWDAEWTDRFFTSLDFQHQEFEDISILVPAGITTIDLQEGRIDRASATANMRLGGGFGAFATFAYADSENQDPDSIGFGGPVPFVPETAARLGLTWVNPANVKVTVAATYVGKRTGDESGTELDPYWTADAFLTWEPFDKRFALELAGYNLLNEEFDVAPYTPGWGRSFVGSFKVRF
jgi:tetratricopeptide (TPR) repeat protein